MIILGLTGSIGMGKTATAAMFMEAGIPVYDADAAVHGIYETGGSAVGPIGNWLPDVIRNGAIDRAALREHVLNDDGALKKLESIVHPLVGATQMAFRQSALENGEGLVVLDIPLLFETGGDARCDYVAMVTAPAELQRTRVLSRPGADEKHFEAILAKQLPDAEKRERSDFVISTAFGFDFTRAHVSAIIDLMIRLNEGAET